MPRAHQACQDFHHASEAARRGALTRRQLIRQGVGGGLAIYAASALPLPQAFEAAAAEAAAAPDAPILVSVFLPGGADLLDTLVPLQQWGPYNDARQGMALAGAQPLGGTGLGLHPSLSMGPAGGLRGLYERGLIGFLPGIDYANPNLSHFASRGFWETGMVSQQAVSGWLGRWLDHHGSRDNPLQGVSSDHGLSPTLRSAHAPVSSVSGSAELWMRDVWGEWWEAALDGYWQLARPAPRRPGPSAAMEAARLAHVVAAKLRPYRKEDDKPDPLASPVAYPADNELGERLQRLAGLLAQPLGIRIGTVESDGDFDTHGDQPATLARDLGALSEALAAFQADLDARGLAQRVLTFVWSEFGRRPEGNRSQGSDHGAGGIAWVQGPRAAPGILTEYPSLTALDDHDNLRVTVDFRRVYASLLAQWLGTDPAQVIPGAAAFGQVALVR